MLSCVALTLKTRIAPILEKMILYRKIAIAVLLLWGTVALHGQTGISGDYVNVVDSLVRLSTSDGMTTDAMLDAMLPNLKDQYPDVPEEIFNDVANRLKKEMKTRMSHSIAEVYSKYFTIDEVRQLIGFYKTPIGKKLSQSLPEMTPQLYKKGEEIGRSVVEKYIAELDTLDI